MAETFSSAHNSEAEPEQHLLSGDVTPPEDQRSPSEDQGFSQRTSGTSYEPVCSSSCGPRRLHAALAAFMRPSLPSCGRRLLRAALAAFVRSSPPSCGPPSSPPHTGLGPVVLQGPFLAAALPRCRPLLQSSLHLHEDAVWGGGAPVEDRIVVKYNLRNMCRIYVSLIMAPVRQFICVT
jgi:hypothetical protein